uniref:Ribosomal RNA-processing protein 8 n=1 Tax=Trepomonas sp. PC1 TaxID=1076344 RepID=A0A146KIC3_9EUKA|eukprot:JAP95141.1 Ribosomal RNA-processing protein [Trepomonas sp. PC1]
MPPVKNHAKTKQNMNSSIFRLLNEELYTKSSGFSAQKFKESPELFKIYHDGYKQQLDQWPIKPFDIASKFVQQFKNNEKIGDIGCGTAQLAQKFKQCNIESFDIGCTDDIKELVRIANMTNLPVADEYFDALVYSLSIMPTDQYKVLNEAHRILKMNGTMLIIEVISRVKNVDEFAKKVEKYGFKCTIKEENKFFFSCEFQKIEKGEGTGGLLDPCIYKRR